MKTIVKMHRLHKKMTIIDEYHATITCIWCFKDFIWQQSDNDQKRKYDLFHNKNIVLASLHKITVFFLFLMLLLDYSVLLCYYDVSWYD